MLPPKSYRNRSRYYEHRVPDFDDVELEGMQPQLRKKFAAGNTVDLGDGGKQQAIQDCYAFCAYATY